MLLAALCAALFFWRLGAVPLIGLDEGLYAETSREMLVGGDYIVPMYIDRPFCDKPPLCYWLQTGSMRAFGVSSFAVRLPSATAAALLVGLTVLLGTRLFDRRAGLFAGFALATPILGGALARLCSMDQVFALTITAALGAFLLSHLGILPRWGYAVFWAATGLSVMTKGPAGAVLILVTAAAFLLIRRQPRAALRAMPVAGLILFAAIALPWYMLVDIRTEGLFLREFLVHQNIDRALGNDFHHNLAFWVYVPLYFLSFFPWSMFVPLAWRESVRLQPADKREEASLFAAVWVVSIVAVFSFSKSKLPSYIFPALPPSALLVGLTWSRAVECGKPVALRRSAVMALAVAALFGAAMILGQRFLPRPIPGLALALAPMGAALIAGSGAAVLMLTRNRPVGAFAVLCAGASALMLAAVGLGLPIVACELSDPVRAAAAQVRKLDVTSERQTPGTPGTALNQTLVSLRLHREQGALSFYSGRPILNIDSPDKLLRLRNSGRGFILITHEEFVPQVLSDRGAFAGEPAARVIIARCGPYLFLRSPGPDRPR